MVIKEQKIGDKKPYIFHYRCSKNGYVLIPRKPDVCENSFSGYTIGYDQNKNVFAVATCSQHDQWVRKIGTKIVLARLQNTNKQQSVEFDLLTEELILEKRLCHEKCYNTITNWNHNASTPLKYIEVLHAANHIVRILNNAQIKLTNKMNFQEVNSPLNHGEPHSSFFESVFYEPSSNQLVERLLKLDAQKDWDVLKQDVLQAHDSFFTKEQSEQIGPRLLEIAKYRCDSNKDEDRAVTYAAIRRGASMLLPDQAHLLVPFFRYGLPIETPIVAMKMLGRIFEAHPPKSVDEYLTLTVKVSCVASEMLKQDVIQRERDGSDGAPLAMLSICALAAMGSSNLLNIIGVAKELEQSWFNKQVARDLIDLKNRWNGRASKELLELLEKSIALLN